MSEEKCRWCHGPVEIAIVYVEDYGDEECFYCPECKKYWDIDEDDED